MIDDKTKLKLIEELEKIGNVAFACAKVGIHRSTYHRWKKEDGAFRKRAVEAERLGRENLCDAAEQGLIMNVKKGHMDAIKYVLSHNSPIYKPKAASSVVIEHRKYVMPSRKPKSTLEDDFDPDSPDDDSL